MATALAPAAQLDPIKLEIFAHRLWQIGEEGRLALQRVTASPIVAQGGECMSSFYAPDGTMILACSGHLRFAAATPDAIKKLVEWFGVSPGIFDGVQPSGPPENASEASPSARDSARRAERAGATGQVEAQATELRRAATRRERLGGEPNPPAPFPKGKGDRGLGPDWQPVLRFHEYLELVRAGAELAVRCRRCRRVLCRADQNYKAHVRQHTRELGELSGKRLPSGEAYRGVYQEYVCPGCATLLQVDVHCPGMSGGEPLWDIRLDLAQFLAR